MIPTEDGKLLYANIAQALNQLEKAEQHFKKTSQDKVISLNVGMCSEIFQHVIEPKIPTLTFDLVARFGDHSELIKDLSNGILDLVITPKRSSDKFQDIEYSDFSIEKIVLVASKNTDTSLLEQLIDNAEIKTLEETFKKFTWYSASNEMDHFRRFWYDNFSSKPSFKPNFILPNISSIIRCLKTSEGLAVLPDFLVKDEIDIGQLKLLWKGVNTTSNTLSFAKRKIASNRNEIESIEKLFIEKMPKL